VALNTLFEDVEIPHVEFVFEKVDIRAWIVALRWFTLDIGFPRKIDDVDQRVRLVEIGQKLIAEAVALVGPGDQPRHIDELCRHKAGAVPTDANVRRAGLIELRGRTLDANVRLADAGVDRCKWIGTLGHIVFRRRVEEAGFADRWFTHQADPITHYRCWSAIGQKPFYPSARR
jgi:hypothetical protein